MMDPVGIIFFALIGILVISAVVIPQIQRASQKSPSDNHKN